ncbi:MAG: glutaredoxin family protein [Congregibacter sp.]|nr:glutaredoxin family protein [Congregibacter sp.]
MTQVRLILYSTLGCHLCEEAEALLRAEQAQGAELRWEVIDIANSDALFERYGWLIPVLRDADADSDSSTDALIDTDTDTRGPSNELHWPFDAQSLRVFLASRDRV